MKITTIAARELSREHFAAWSEIQRANPTLDSPYFRPEFTQVVASVRDDVEVGVMEDHGQFVGFFPFQRRFGGVAHPVGGRLSDFQGVIIGPDVKWTAAELLRGCGLRAWHFDHLLVSQEPLRPYHRTVEDSPYVDLTGGYAAYIARNNRSATNPFSHCANKTGRLQRQEGPLRYEPDIRDASVLETLLAWKTEQYVRTGVTNVFGVSWTGDIVRKIFACPRGSGQAAFDSALGGVPNEAFAGVLSGFYAGDRLLAIDFSMRSYGVLHNWFPCYDPAFAKFSPGAFREVELLKMAGSVGIHRIDYGKGMNPHKEHFMSAATQVAVGSADRRWLVPVLRRQWHRTYDWARDSGLREPARAPARILYRIREWMAFH